MGLRDIALTLLLVGALPLALVRPYLGVLVFAWISLMNPHRLTFGFAYGFSWALYVALATLAGFLVAKDKLVADSLSRYRIALLYVAWMGVTTIFAFSTDWALPKFIEVVKIQLMCVVTLCLLTTQRRTEIFVMVAVASVAFFGVKGGLFTLLTAGAYRVFGPDGSVLADNNQLATGLVMTVPLLYWMARTAKQRWLQYAGYACMALTAVSIFGSHSRGAFLGVAAMGAMMVMKSDRKFAALLFAVLAGSIAVILMPDEYWARMQSIGEYQEDQSSQGRLEMWNAAINVASSYITGGGFDLYRSPQFLAFIRTIPRSAHSVYFQALGEHGWIGLGLLLTFWGSIFLQSRRAAKELAAIPGTENMRLLMLMTQVSLVGFAVGGAFVNIGYWDFPFDIALGVLAVRRLVASGALQQDAAARTSTTAASGRPRPFPGPLGAGRGAVARSARTP